MPKQVSKSRLVQRRTPNDVSRHCLKFESSLRHQENGQPARMQAAVPWGAIRDEAASVTEDTIQCQQNHFHASGVTKPVRLGVSEPESLRA